MGKGSAFYREKDDKYDETFQKKLDMLPECARQYLEFKRRSVRMSTLVAYAYDLLTFYEFVEANGKAGELGEMTAEDIVAYGNYLESNEEGVRHKNGSQSIARKMVPLRGMFAHQYARGKISSNPMLLVTTPKQVKDKCIVRMSNEEVQAVQNAIENGVEGMTDWQRFYAEKTKKRDRALIMLTLTTGIRVAECNGLDLTDVNLYNNSITIVRKGGGGDVLYFDETVRGYLTEYIETERARLAARKAKRKSDQEAMFLSMRGTRLSRNAIEQVVKKYTKPVIPDKRITPHKLRSTYGSALYQKTGDIRLVAEVLGHENVNTTIRYYAAIDDERKKSVAGLVTYK